MFLVFIAVLFASSVFAQTPVACDGIAFGVGNLSISSTTDSSVNLQLLDAGPSHNRAGLPILQTSTVADPEIWIFLTCNSSFMGYINTLDRGPNNTVSFYGHIIRPGEVGQPADKYCLERASNGDIVQGLCSFVDGPSQLPQYWKMVKSATTPLDPAPVTFLGAPNGTTPPVNFIPSYNTFNNSKIVSEVITKSTAQPEFQLFFTEDE